MGAYPGRRGGHDRHLELVFCPFAKNYSAKGRVYQQHHPAFFYAPDNSSQSYAGHAADADCDLERNYGAGRDQSVGCVGSYLDLYQFAGFTSSRRPDLDLIYRDSFSFIAWQVSAQCGSAQTRSFQEWQCPGQTKLRCAVQPDIARSFDFTGKATMYKRILVPVDGSAASALGLLEAIRFAKDQRARLRIVHIIDESVLIQYPEAGDISGQVLDSFVKSGEKTLRDAVALAKRHRIKPEHVLYKTLVGTVADVILKEAKKWRADIIVMGTHKQSTVQHFFLGSDAETIARSTRLPVLLIHGAPQPKRKRAAR